MRQIFAGNAEVVRVVVVPGGEYDGTRPIGLRIVRPADRDRWPRSPLDIDNLFVGTDIQRVVLGDPAVVEQSIPAGRFSWLAMKERPRSRCARAWRRRSCRGDSASIVETILRRSSRMHGMPARPAATPTARPQGPAPIARRSVVSMSGTGRHLMLTSTTRLDAPSASSPQFRAYTSMIWSRRVPTLT